MTSLRVRSPVPPEVPIPDASPHARPAQYLTAQFPGIGGLLRQRAEDFLVEEVPAYEPCGEGEHIYLFVQKRDLSTLQLVDVIAKHFRVRPSDVGYAGLKDKRAITRQVISIHAPGKTPEDFPSLQHDRVAVLWSDLHTNKLRRGHLKGNRFSIRVRGVPIQAALTALKVLRTLERVGVPNRAGVQRFGQLQNNHLIGAAIVRGQWPRAVDELLGPAGVRDPAGSADIPHQLEARRLYQQGRYADALRLVPPSAEPEFAALRALSRGATPEQAIGAINQTHRQFYLHGLQSAIFNTILDARIASGTLGELVLNDLAFKHENGSVFSVDQAALDADDLPARAAALEISPSGPMWGTGMKRATGAIDELELAHLARVHLTPDAIADYCTRSGDELPGARRPLRVPLMYAEVEAGSDEHGLYVRCGFELPPGAFATVVMDEVMKADTGHDPHDDAPVEGSPTR